MYNEQQKLAYIDQCLSNEKKQRFKTLFERLDPAEIEFGCDIAEVNVNDYPDILLRFMPIHRFPQFKRYYNDLCSYRLFCWNRGFISDEAWIKNNPSEFNKAISAPELIDLFNQYLVHKNVDNIFCDPDILYNYLHENIFTKAGEMRSSLYEISERKLNLDEFTLLYVMLNFFGICGNDLAELRIDNITSNETFPISTQEDLIYLKGQCYKITGKTSRLLRKRLNNVILSYYRGASNAETSFALHSKYLMLLEIDDPKDGQKRINKHYTNYANRIRELKQANVFIPTISNIIVGGEIYRLCSKVITSEQETNTIIKLTKEEIIQRYNWISKKPVSSTNAKQEIVRRYEHTYNYMHYILEPTDIDD